MNINLNKSNRNCQLFPVFQEQASPYLSPLQGLNSPISSLYNDDFLNFALEEQSNHEPQDNHIQVQNTLLNQIHLQQSSSPIVRVQDQEKAETKELQTPSFLAKPSQSKIQSIIRFLVANDKLSQNQIRTLGMPLYQNDESLEYVFKSLMGKFKKLKKTKEEMTKFCMRKAFKFINDNKRNLKKKNSSSKKEKQPEEEQMEFQMPFKKNSSQKTMNNQFLRQLFSRKEFVVYYDKFLNDIHNLIEEDNDGKIIYLSNTIEGYVQGNQTQKVDSIKRLPWTQSILKKTQELAFSMNEFVEGESFISRSKQKTL